jgi:hypothetical protein
MEPRRGVVLVDIAVWTGRFLGLLVVGIALAVSIKVAQDARVDQFWSFLATLMTPMGVGFIILVISEVLNRLGRSQE